MRSRINSKRACRACKRSTPDKVKVTPEKCFVGLDAYQKVIDSGVDVVLLATPPGFRPVHLKAAVDAGKHIFCEKPMATDAPGVRSVLESVKAAKEKSLSLVAGFCWRYEAARREFYKRIHDGAIGDIRAIYATYYTGPVKPMPPASERPAGMGDLEWQMRNWYNFIWLSGDGYVEQACHSVDKVAWAMKDQSPLKAVAVGGRQTPNNQGDIFDHMFVVYEFPDDVRAFVGPAPDRQHVLGQFGLPHGRRRLWQDSGWAAPYLKGKENWRYKGPKTDMYQTRAQRTVRQHPQRQADQRRRVDGAQHADGDHGPHGRLHRPGNHLGASHELAGETRARPARLEDEAGHRPDGHAGRDQTRINRIRS